MRSMLTCPAGINLVTYYLSTLLENSLGFEQEMSRLLAGVNGELRDPAA